MDRSSWMSPEDRDIMRSTAKRDRNETRKTTILDPRTRRIGIDIDAIQQQIQEKREREAREKARDDAFDNMVLTQQDIIMDKMEQERQARRKMAEDRDRFRMSVQQPSNSLEYDIWRPDLLKVSRPARVGDEDPTLGVSSGQIFQGEDLHISERLAAQARQRRDWYNEQMKEKQAEQRRAQMEDLQNQLVELETQKTLADLDARTEYAKSQIRREVADDNYNMFLDKRRREKEDKERDEQMNNAEMISNVRTGIISERMARRGDAPQDYRGMTIEDQKQIIDEQAAQMKDNERRRQEEREREQQWYEYQEYLKSEGDRNEATWLRRKQQEQEQLYRTRLQQEEEFKRRERYLNKEVYGKNVPDDYFYNSWGNDVR
ncbi:Protein Tax-1 [Tritrichomonas musculus]|uniref:Protein Tax-1 n=1 Tax=Tritrichomonas musculus TaxID=1915356 RepID=A0ABR2KI92_9EUKA